MSFPRQPPSGRAHVAWGRCSDAAKHLLARNVHVLLSMPDRMRITRFVGQPRLGETPYPCAPEPLDDSSPAAAAA